MKTIYEYLITPLGERYNNVKEIQGKKLILNATIDEKDFKFTNRIAVVVETPSKGGVVEKGDMVIVHSNTFRRWYNVRGKLKQSSNLIKDELFSADLDQIYAYNRGNGWITLEDYCFIKPIPREGAIFHQAGIYEPLVGIVKFNNPWIERQGVKVGDKIAFSENSEFAFEIDGEVLYKMSSSRDVKLVYGHKETAESAESSV